MPGPTDSKARKATPLTRGCLDYFPDALMAVAVLSLRANDKHNPGQELHWSKGKSNDHADCVARHLTERGTYDPDMRLSHTVALAWRGLALLQTEIEDAGGWDAWMGQWELAGAVAADDRPVPDLVLDTAAFLHGAPQTEDDTFRDADKGLGQSGGDHGDECPCAGCQRVRAYQPAPIRSYVSPRAG